MAQYPIAGAEKVDAGGKANHAIGMSFLSMDSAAMAAKRCIPCLCAICLGIVCRADEWKVSGNGFEGVARLPGTLADAGLGVRQNYETWSHVKDRVEKGALRLSHVYRGEATWSRMVEVPETPSCRRL